MNITPRARGEKENRTNMAAISAGFNFTPPVPGGQMTVTGATFTEVKGNAIAALEVKKAQPTADLAAINAAQAALSA